MFRALNKLTAWFLIITLAIIASVGEGLHGIPGSGHGVEIGDRILLLGISLPEEMQPTDGQPRAERPEGQNIPIYDENLCAICSAVGLSCTSADSLQFVLVMPLVHDLPAIALRNEFAATVSLFQARAPPLV